MLRVHIIASLTVVSSYVSARCMQFRKKVEALNIADALKKEEEDDKNTVLKFLNARGWNVAKAVEMFRCCT